MPKRPWSTKVRAVFSFLLTFLLCFGLFIGTAFALLRTPGNPKPTPVESQPDTTLVWGHLNTVVLVCIGHHPADAAYFTLDIKAQLQSAFLEEAPLRRATVSGRTDTLAGHADHSGMQTAKTAAEKLCNTPVARFVFLTPDVLAAFCDALGGVILSSGGVQQRYAGAQFVELLHTGDARALLCRLLQQFFTDENALFAGAGVLFSKADTDLSAPDLQDHKKWLTGLAVY